MFPHRASCFMQLVPRIVFRHALAIPGHCIVPTRHDNSTSPTTRRHAPRLASGGPYALMDMSDGWTSVRFGALLPSPWRVSVASILAQLCYANDSSRSPDARPKVKMIACICYLAAQSDWIESYKFSENITCRGALLHIDCRPPCPCSQLRPTLDCSYMSSTISSACSSQTRTAPPPSSAPHPQCALSHRCKHPPALSAERRRI
jgi:hypothetical protein